MALHYRRRFSISGRFDDVREAIRAYYVGEGCDLVRETDDVLTFQRPNLSARGLGLDVSRASASIRVGIEADGPDIWVTADCRVAPAFRLSTRIDGLFYRLEVEALKHYVQTGVRRVTRARVERVRRPVVTAVGVNTAFAVLVIAAIGSLGDFPSTIVGALAIVVSLINAASIVGFADVLIEGVETSLDFDSLGA